MIKDYLDEKLHEECGVFGVYRRDADLDVVGTTYYGLYALQHRGQESCGMAVNDDGVFYKRRELGLVNDVFTKDVPVSYTHLALAVKRIEETLRAQLESGAYRTCIVPMPPKFEIIIRYKEHRAAYRCSFYPGVEQVDEKTLRFICVDYMDAMCLFQFVL